MERPRQLADELNKAQKRIVLWVGETSAENILATKDLAKSVRVEHISSNDAKELLPLFEGTATVQSTCFVIKVDDTDILVRLIKDFFLFSLRVLAFELRSNDRLQHARIRTGKRLEGS